MAPRSEYAASAYYDEEPDADYDDSDTGNDSYSRSGSTAPTDDNGYFITQSERLMNRLHELHASTDWKKVLKHKKGVVVHVQKGHGTVYRGQHTIKGYSPAAVFAVVGTRKLWDEWYQSGSLVENLNDTTSLTYMVMKGIAGSSTRDLSLVEKVEGSANGTIFFCSSSVDSAKVPRVSGRIRAQIALNGWCLEPVKSGSSTSTLVSYYLQVNVKTFVPKVLTGKYLARRPVCISRIDDYLQKNGAPPLAGVDEAEQRPARSSDSQSTRSGRGGGGMVGGAAMPSRKRRSSTGSVRSGRSTGAASSFLSAPSISEGHKSSGDLEKGRALFDDLSGDSSGWQVATDQRGARFHMKDAKGGLPIIKAAVKIEGVTTEQILGTIISQAARRIWDDRWMKNELIEPVNGHEHGVYLEVIKGIFPHIDNTHFVLAKGVEREEPTSPNGAITYIARSTTSAEPKSKLLSKEGKLEVAGWRIEDEGNGSVEVEHIIQSDLKTDKIKNKALMKTVVVSVAKAPRLLQEFIDERGYAPYFVRWEEGAAHLEHDDGDLERGEATFRISSGKSKSDKKSGEQRAWLQWSEKMYERGISINVEPSDAATIAKVEGLERTVEFIWKDVGKGATVSLERYNKGNGAEDVYVDGEFLDRSVSVGIVADAAPVSKKKPKKAPKREPEEESAPAQKDEGPSKSGGGGGGFLGGVVGSKGAAPVVNAVAPGRAERDGETGKKQIPDDAMLILGDNLYFTRSQVSVIAALLGFVVLLARVL